MPTESQYNDIRWALTELSERQPFYVLHGGYYNGRHRLMIDRQRLRTIFANLFRDFRLNLCSPVVDALADRLVVQSFSSPGDEDDDAISQTTAEIWKRNRMSRRAGAVHQTAISHGDSYVIVWPDDQQRAILYPQAPHEVCVKYDPDTPGKIVRGAKLWQDEEKRYRLNLYYEDRVEKYHTDPRTEGQVPGAQDFSERNEDGERWPLTHEYGRVPVFHFANNADLGEYGVSELRDAVPVQDWMNYSVFSLLVGQEFQAFPQRYAIGVEVPEDENGNKVSPFKTGPERVWALEGEGDKSVGVGQFAAADLDKMLNVKREISLTMAQVTGTPPHYFMLTANQVSGESQKTAEQKLDAKQRDREVSFGDVWAGAIAFAAKVESGRALDGLELETNWEDTKPRNQLEDWQVAGMKAEHGVSDDQILREQGYTPDQIEQFKTEARGREPGAALPRLSFGVPDTNGREG